MDLWRGIIERVCERTRQDYHPADFALEMETSLCTIMGKYGSDKSTVEQVVGHNYTRVYDALFDPIRRGKLRIFELGLGTCAPDAPSSMAGLGKECASVRGWAEYFPNSAIFGADIDKRILFSTDRIQTFVCDMKDVKTIKELWENHELEGSLDVIIDDALHEFDANVMFFENSIHKLAPGGFYIIEDVHNQYHSLWHSKLEEWKVMYLHLSFSFVKLPHKHNCSNNTLIIVRNTEPRKAVLPDAYFCINLEHRADRRVHFEEQMLAAGLPADKFKFHKATYVPERGIAGCVLSHISALKEAYSHPEWEYVAIFEDDFTFKRPSEFFKELAFFFSEFVPDVLMLARDTLLLKTAPTHNPHIEQIRKALTTSGYIVRREYIPTLIANFEESHKLLLTGPCELYALDTYWGKLQEKDAFYSFASPQGHQI